MIVKLTMDWAGNIKGDEVDVTDQSVLDKGFEIGLFVDPKVKKEVKPKTEK